MPPHALSDPTDLTAALAAELRGHRDNELAPSVRALMTAYRDHPAPSGPDLHSPAAALAYAAYRMPATHAAVVAVLSAATAARPGLAPRTMLDVGGGTGAALWAAVRAFPTLTTATVLDRSTPAMRLGRRLAARSATGALTTATWVHTRITPRVRLPRADLMTLAYLLAELPSADRHAVISAAGRDADLVVVVEPGTPAGYRRVLEARRLLVARGHRVLAPCPHDGHCPLAGGTDWCHFAVRLNRSPTHRRLKRGSRGYEDEKFAYVVTARTGPVARSGRVIRRTRARDGVVDLDVCTTAHDVRRVRLSRRDGGVYHAARHTAWGDAWTGDA
jgi:ribosomal protein RSM22 (predicted rRNA methylase)